MSVSLCGALESVERLTSRWQLAQCYIHTYIRRELSTPRVLWFDVFSAQVLVFEEDFVLAAAEVRPSVTAAELKRYEALQEKYSSTAKGSGKPKPVGGGGDGGGGGGGGRGGRG